MAALGQVIDDIHGWKPIQTHNVHWLHSTLQWYSQVLNKVQSGLQNAVPEFTCDKAEAGGAKWPVQTFRCKQMGNANDRLGSLTSHADATSWQGQDSSAINLPSSFPSSHDQQSLFKIFLYFVRLFLSYCMYGSTSA